MYSFKSKFVSLSIIIIPIALFVLILFCLYMAPVYLSNDAIAISLGIFFGFISIAVAVLFGFSDKVRDFLLETKNTPDESAKANGVKRLLSPKENLLELDVSRYFLSGHPAIRLVEMVNVKSSPPLDEMPEDFPKYLPTAQSMIDSFQIISRQ